MSKTTDLRQIQRRTHQLMSFEDGLWDLLLGSIFMFLAIYPVTRELLGPVWNLVLFLSVLALLVVGQLVVQRTEDRLCPTTSLAEAAPAGDLHHPDGADHIRFGPVDTAQPRGGN